MNLRLILRNSLFSLKTHNSYLTCSFFIIVNFSTNLSPLKSVISDTETCILLSCFLISVHDWHPYNNLRTHITFNYVPGRSLFLTTRSDYSTYHLHASLNISIIIFRYCQQNIVPQTARFFDNFIINYNILLVGSLPGNDITLFLTAKFFVT